MIRTLLLFAGLLLSLVSEAQFRNMSQKKISQVRGRNLKVILLSENPKFGKNKLKDVREQSLPAYKACIKPFNDTLRSVVDKYWHFSKSISYTTEAELANSDGLDTGTVFLMIGLNLNNMDYYKYDNYYHRDTKVDKVEDDKYNRFGQAEIVLYESNEKGKLRDIYNYAVPGVFPRAGDLIFALERMQLYFNTQSADPKYTLGVTAYKKESKETGDLLKDKILLVDKDKFASPLTEDKVKAYYPYPFMLVTADVIDSAVVSGNEKYCYINYLQEEDELMSALRVVSILSYGFGTGLMIPMGRSQQSCFVIADCRNSRLLRSSSLLYGYERRPMSLNMLKLMLPISSVKK